MLAVVTPEKAIEKSTAFISIFVVDSPSLSSPAMGVVILLCFVLFVLFVPDCVSHERLVRM